MSAFGANSLGGGGDVTQPRSSTGGGAPALMPALQSLLAATANVAATANPLGMPTIDRSLDDLAEATARLAKRSTGARRGTEALAAARVLASTGQDALALSRELREVDVDMQIEPTLPELISSASLEEWIASVQDVSILSAVRESQKSSQASFKQKIEDVINLGWQNSRSKFAVAAASHHQHNQSAMAPSSLGTTPSPAKKRTTRAAGFLDVVQSINRSLASGIPYDAIADVVAMGASLKDSADAGSYSHTSLRNLWQVVSSVLSSAKPGSRPKTKEEIAALRAALCKSARRHLERDYATFVAEEIERHPQLAMLGGSPSRVQQIRAFLRIRLNDRGALDFDMPGGIDTFWHQLYFCLRCGYIEEAVQLSEAVQGEGMMGDMYGSGVASLPDYLREWQNKGELSSSNQAMVRLDGERILREQDRSSYGKNQFRILIYTILCADRHLAESLLSDQYLFTNIEDFLWFKLTLVREGQLIILAPTYSTQEEPHRLAELQQQLAQYPASYYTRDGKEPLLYAILLVLTLQFEAAVQYLSTYLPASGAGLGGGVGAALYHDGVLLQW